MQEETKIFINDIEVCLRQCAHCNARPNEADAQRAIAEFNDGRYGRICCVCGEQVQPGRFFIQHSGGYKDPAEWSAFPDHRTWLSVGVLIDSRDYPVGIGAHLECLKRALPYMPRYALERRHEDVIAVGSSTEKGQSASITDVFASTKASPKDSIKKL